MVTIISSQRYIDDGTVAGHRENNNYDAMYSPVFTVDGHQYRVVLDGHHRVAAARLDGVDVTWVEADCGDDDRVGLLEQGRIDDFLIATHMGNDYYDINTGHDVW